MRFVLGFLAVMFLAVMLAPSSLLAQSDTVRGCVAETTPRGVWLMTSRVTSERARQGLDTSDLDERGQRFLLVGDDDLLEEIGFREGHEVEVTGLLNPETSSPAIVEPPVLQPPGGGNSPGAGWPPNPRGTTRVRDTGGAGWPSPRGTRVSDPGVAAGPFATWEPTDIILVEEYREFGPGCRVGRPPRF